MLVFAGNDINHVESTYVNNYLINIGKPRGRYKTDGNTADSICNEANFLRCCCFPGWLANGTAEKLIRFAAVMFSVKALQGIWCVAVYRSCM